MKIEVTTHNEILTDPIIELERTIDNPKNKTFQPVIVLIDKENPVRRFGQFLPEQHYINDTWTDEDVENAILSHIESVKIEEIQNRNKSSVFIPEISKDGSVKIQEKKIRIKYSWVHIFINWVKRIFKRKK